MYIYTRTQDDSKNFIENCLKPKGIMLNRSIWLTDLNNFGTMGPIKNLMKTMDPLFKIIYEYKYYNKFTFIFRVFSDLSQI